MSRIYGVKGLFGSDDYYDEDGNHVGYSIEGALGEKNHYDSGGRFIGCSMDGMFGGKVHYDANGNPAGYSTDGIIGMNHYTNDGSFAGHSGPTLAGSYNDLDEPFMDSFDDFDF